MKRLFLLTALLLSFFLLPWYITAILSVIGLVLYENYYEFFVIGMMIYAVYTPNNYNVGPFIFAVLILVLFFGLNYLKRYIIFYQK